MDRQTDRQTNSLTN